MPEFAVTIVETVIMTYAPLVIDVTYKAVPSNARVPAGPETNPPLFVTDQGLESLAGTQAPCGT